MDGVLVNPCTHRSRRCRDARDHGRELRECCRAHVREMMAELAPRLTGAGVTWWADYGTLLGAVRNPMTTWADYPWLPQSGRTTEGPAAGIIPHDKDADLGVLWGDWANVRAVKDELRLLGYHVRMDGGKGSMKLRLSRLNHTNIDLFFWDVAGDGTMSRRGYADRDKCKGREFHVAAIQPMGEVEWEGMTLPAPNDPESFLAMRYGKGWRTPIPANHDGVRR